MINQAPALNLDLQVSFRDGLGNQLLGTGTLASRQDLSVRIHAPDLVLRISELIQNLVIKVGEEVLYQGKGLIRNLVDSGSTVVCGIQLEQPLFIEASAEGPLQTDFTKFFRQWEQTFRLAQTVKQAVLDLHSFLTEFDGWSRFIDLRHPGAEPFEVLGPSVGTVIKTIDSLFARFEEATRKVEERFIVAHQVFGQRLIHPLLLGAPFVYRTLRKPLGYAGDYQMVNMMFEPPWQGKTLFPKMINGYALQLPPIRAHRNRLDYLQTKLQEVVLASAAVKKKAQIYNLGCGPAVEVQRFINDSALADYADFELVDFNDETVIYTGAKLKALRQEKGRATQVAMKNLSVQQLLKKASAGQQRQETYDLVYCAGLYDYLADRAALAVSNFLYSLVRPGGILIITNVDDHPSRFQMECFLEWHLIYRNATQLRRIGPSVPEDQVSIVSDPCGINLFLEAKKPARA